jgi:hypothetical protein
MEPCSAPSADRGANILAPKIVEAAAGPLLRRREAERIGATAG